MKTPKTAPPITILTVLAATKGLDRSSAISRIGLVSFCSCLRNSRRKPALRARETAAKRSEEPESFSPAMLSPNMRKSTVPLKKEAPAMSILGREITFESFRRMRVPIIRARPIGRLI